MNPENKKGGWTEMIRPPNLFTVPGDILAGALLAGLSSGGILYLIPAIFCSLLLYIAGLILNDYFDRKKDKVERPFRPIPSGRVEPGRALLAGAGLIVLALIFGFFINTGFFKTALILALLIIAYNSFARKIPVLGFAVMGLCRGFNIFLGAALVSLSFNPYVISAAAIETLYVAGLTAFAFNEVKGNRASLIGKLVRGLIIIQLVFISVSGLGKTLPGMFYIPVFTGMFLLLFLANRAAKSFQGS